MNLFIPFFIFTVFGADNGNFAELVIRGPRSLVAELNGTQIFGRPALFGFPEYNGEFVGHLRLAPESNLDGCESFDESAFFSLEDEIIAVIDRGTCHFVTKVYNAQVAGAKGAVIVNNLDGEFLPFMADDGLGSVVDIPSILIQKSHGNILKEALAHQLVIETEIKWGLTGAGSAVEWQFFTSVVPSSDEIQFVKDFLPAVEALGENQNFQVHLRNQEFTYDDDDCYKSFYCFEGQMINGHYVYGYDIVKETLRQLCIYQIGNRTNHNLLWWQYRTEMDYRCFNGHETCYDGRVSDHIVQDLSKHINIDLEHMIHVCEQNEDIDLLEAEQQAFIDYRISWTPRITVNGDFYHGKYGCPDVNVEICSLLSAMCSTFEEPVPDACVARPVTEESVVYKGESSLRSVVIFLLIGFMSIAILGGVALWRMKRTLNQTTSDFQAMRNIYHPLEEENQEEYPTGVNANSLVQQSEAV